MITGAASHRGQMALILANCVAIYNGHLNKADLAMELRWLCINCGVSKRLLLPWPNNNILGLVKIQNDLVKSCGCKVNAN